MISVCLATYNGEEYIREQMVSILSQLAPMDEVIVSDDLSTDSTLDIIRSLGDSRVKILLNEGEHGYTANFENAIRNTHGDYIFLSDQDDVWARDKVSCCMELFSTYDFIISDAELIDGRGKTTSPSFFEIRRSKPGLFNNLVRFSYLGCCIAFKKKILSRALPFPPNHRYCTHDNWLSLVGMAFYKTKVTDKKLIGYRRHENNASTGGFRKVTTLRFMMAYRLYLVKWLIIRAFPHKH